MITGTRFREFTVREDDDADLGRAVITDGRLTKLRNQLGLSRQAMAEYLHTSTIVYASWETRAVRLWPSTAGRVGRFYRFATKELRILEDDGIELSNLMPLYLAAAAIGIPQELLLSWYRAGDFEAVDLGILGLWVHRDDLAEVL